MVINCHVLDSKGAALGCYDYNNAESGDYTAAKKVLGFFNSNFIMRRTNVASVSNAGNVSQNPKTYFCFE
jgi:hypothetical protein